MVTIFLMQGSGPQPVTVHGAVARLMRPLTILSAKESQPRR